MNKKNREKNKNSKIHRMNLDKINPTILKKIINSDSSGSHLSLKISESRHC